jgi:YD repeat-containing protein
MKKVFLFLITMTAVVGCSKDKRPNMDENSDCLVQTIDMGLTKDGILNFSYDTQNRISRVNFEKHGTGDSYLNQDYNISYSSNQITITGYSSAVFNLDNQGRIIKSAEENDGERTYSYNSAGYLETVTFKDNSKASFTYTNGNLTGFNIGNYKYSTEYDTNNAYVAYSYDITQNEILHYAYGPVLYEQGRYGKVNKNRVSKVDGETYVYTLDDSSKKIKSIIINKGEYGMDNMNFSYSCK